MRRSPPCGGGYFEQSKVVVEVRIGKAQVSLRPALERVTATQLRPHPFLGMRFDPTNNRP
jgi:hypothetical protein